MAGFGAIFSRFRGAQMLFEKIKLVERQKIIAFTRSLAFKKGIL
jgi:hypothetical protein